LDLSKTDSYDYTLASWQIASYPANPKDSSKLLVYNRTTKKITHTIFKNILDFIPNNSAFILNDTKVIKARIFGYKSSGGKIELLLNKPLKNNIYSVYIKGKVKVKTILLFDNELSANVIDLLDDGSRLVKFYIKGSEIDFVTLIKILNSIAHVPLPPYLNRKDNKEDEDLYQSLFAKNNGAVAAPTASLHFTPQLFKKLQSLYKSAYITLHVGAGTFKSVDVQNIKEHKMHSEYYKISKEAKELIDSKTPIVAVGTTVARTIEYYVRESKVDGECDLFLNPYNKPIRVNHLLTNFHLPKSTLIMLVSSFLDLETTMMIYKEAIKNKYRFYSYGDAMLII